MQRGRGVIGALIVIAIAVGAGYYVYQGVSGEDAAPTCKSDENRCMQKCRRTSSDSDAAQACQKVCRREAYLCEGLKR
jgi:hypothetical protein